MPLLPFTPPPSSVTPLIAALYGGVIGAIISGFITWRVGTRARRNNYYAALLKLIGDHNWSCLREHLNVGLQITQQNERVVTVCYQHLSFLFYAWLHRDVVTKDGTLDGWQNWAKAIVDGAKVKGNEKFGLYITQS